MKNDIKKIMASVFMTGEKNIADDIRQGDFEKWDSLQHLNLVVALEEHYHVTFEPAEIMDMTDLGKIILYLEKKPSKQLP
jgi:acyl carrier protein